MALGPIGPYEVEDLLGRGAAGMTYRGRHTGLGRPVAIKFLRPQNTGQGSFAERFRLEARVLAALDHPNIVAIHDCGVHKGLLYMILEYVDGCTLRSRLENGGLSLKEAHRITREVLKGLECAHAAGVLHRDIKPDNILLNRAGTVKIVDFGLAKLDDMSSITRAGAVIGTPYYMAPEQCAIPGWGNEVDPRTDLYAVGALFYELLTGQVPHSAATLFELASLKVSQAPDPRRERPDVPEAFAQIVKKLMAPRPEHRYPNAQEVLNILGEHTGTAALRMLRQQVPAEEKARTRRMSKSELLKRRQANLIPAATPVHGYRRPPARPTPAPGADGVHLTLKGSETTLEIDLQTGKKVTLGRSSQRADYPIRDQRLSRLHCEICLSPEGEVWIRDLGSSNGTYVNDRQVEQATALSHGDTIRLGGTSLAVGLPQEESSGGAPAGGLSCSRCGKPVRPGSIVDGRAVVLRDQNLLICAQCALDTPLEERLKTLGFNVEERLDRSGRSSIYRARRASTDEVVALKVLDLDDAVDPEFLERFRKDGRALARLRHPSSVLVFDVRQSASVLFVVMELVVGESLQDRIGRCGKIAAQEALQFAFSVARVCELSEGQGLYHQNISPRSIMLTADGETKLTAFALGGPDAGKVRAEKLRYLAPERLRGDPGFDPARADAYAIGAVLLYALTGRPVHPELSNRDYHTRLRERDLPSYVPDLSDCELSDASQAQLESFVARVISVDPAQRPESMSELVQELEQVIKRTLAPTFNGSAESLFALLSLDTAAGGSTAMFKRNKRTKGTIAGTFEGDELAEFLQMVGLNQRVGTLEIVSDGPSGLVFLDSGMVVGGTCGGLTGMDAVRALLRAREGSFEFRPELPPTAKQFGPVPVSSILLDIMREVDEASQA